MGAVTSFVTEVLLKTANIPADDDAMVPAIARVMDLFYLLFWLVFAFLLV